MDADVKEWADKLPLALKNVGQVLQKACIRRLQARRVAANHQPAAIDQEFLEIPADVSGKAILLGGQPRVQRVPVRAVDLDFRRQGEGHSIGECTEALNLGGRAGLLRAELIAGKSHHGEILIRELLVEFFETRVLRRIPALAGDVHRQGHLAAQCTEKIGAAVETRYLEVEKIVHARKLEIIARSRFFKCTSSSDTAAGV